MISVILSFRVSLLFIFRIPNYICNIVLHIRRNGFKLGRKLWLAFYRSPEYFLEFIQESLVINCRNLQGNLHGRGVYPMRAGSSQNWGWWRD